MCLECALEFQIKSTIFHAIILMNLLEIMAEKENRPIAKKLSITILNTPCLRDFHYEFCIEYKNIQRMPQAVPEFHSKLLR